MLSSTPRVYRFLDLDLELDVVAGELRGRGRDVTLSRRQLAMLRTLACARGKTVSREVLLREVWNGTVVSEGALRQAIWDLRKLLEKNGKRAIEAVRGRGYRLAAEITARPEAGLEGHSHLQSALEHAKKAGEEALSAMAYVSAAEHFRYALHCAELLAESGRSSQQA
jgi:DNA-binding winged helix-turn-helix (wHTH) protein